MLILLTILKNNDSQIATPTFLPVSHDVTLTPFDPRKEDQI